MELGDQRRRALRVDRGERLTRARRDRPRDEHHDAGERRADQERQAGAKAHGSLRTHMLARFQPPDARTAGAFHESTRSPSA